MNISTKIENDLISKIEKVLREFQSFDKPFVNNNGDIIIRKKKTSRETNNVSILTNIFKEIIKNDVKKTGYKTLFRICYNKQYIKL